MIFTLLFSSCMDETPIKEENINVQHFPIVQNNEADNPTLWLRVQFSDQIAKDEWTAIPMDAIIGFDYELGYNYELKIRKEEALNSTTGLHFIKYTFISENEKTPVAAGTTFELPLKSTDFNPSNLVLGNEEVGYNLLGEIDIECSTLCDDLSLDLETNANVNGVFRHIDDNTIKLIQLK
ncbi:DUF4377 domain-containing protein [Echinicola marina]|uniref:DUF4377 domain-containing protein n=1 Tax=Echinicola marina TaxID=2859768 RepID=UPI001CF6CC46|nr:DUF4377 domain-containing protein [Echinicola marina]UCS93028.1 DUF4377 domain-containing protein [Echinicola marina]